MRTSSKSSLSAHSSSNQRDSAAWFSLPWTTTFSSVLWMRPDRVKFDEPVMAIPFS